MRISGRKIAGGIIVLAGVLNGIRSFNHENELHERREGDTFVAAISQDATAQEEEHSLQNYREKLDSYQRDRYFSLALSTACSITAIGVGGYLALTSGRN